jgi:hypothetical protein
MFYIKQCLIISFASILGSIAHGAIDIIFDYSYDQSNFFSDDKKYIMEQAAYAFESRMVNTTFTSINPSDYGGTSSSDPRLMFINPTDRSTEVNIVPGSSTDDGNVVGNANELIIFIGANNMGANKQHASAPVRYNIGYIHPSVTDAWADAMEAKETDSHWEPMAGTISVNMDEDFYFDTDLTTHTDALNSSKMDFYTSMVRAIGHVTGFTTHDAWDANVNSGQWTGSNAKAQYNGQNIPLVSETLPFFDYPSDGSMSTTGNLNLSNIGCACHPSMLQVQNPYTRRPFSELDFAILKDIGYNISNAPEGPNIGGTFTDPTLNGSYFVPVSQSFQDWQNGVPISGSSAAPEPHYIFPILGSLFALGISLKKKLRKVNWTLSKSNQITES